MSLPTVLIIAGGSNNRFFPLNSSVHKGAFTLGGKPLFIQSLESLEQHGFENIIFIITPDDAKHKYTQTLVQEYGIKLSITYITQPKPKGMGDAVLLAQNALSEKFAVIAAYHTTAGEVLTKMLQKKEHNVLLLTETTRPAEYGIAKMKDDKVVGIVEKPSKGTEPSNLKVQSVYVLSEDFLQILKTLPEEEYNFEQALNQLMDRHIAVAAHTDICLPSLKYAWDLFNFQEQAFAHLKSHKGKGVTIAPTAIIDETKGAVVIEDGAQIGHAAHIVGPCYIGKNVRIGDFSLVRSSHLEEGVSVGGFAEVARSIFLPGSTMHTGYVGDSIIGSGTKIGAGFTTANKRLDRKTIHVQVQKGPVDSQRNHLGVLVGERASIGVQVSVMPGKCIGAHTLVYPSCVITQNIPHHSLVKSAQTQLEITSQEVAQ